MNTHAHKFKLWNSRVSHLEPFSASPKGFIFIISSHPLSRWRECGTSSFNSLRFVNVAITSLTRTWRQNGMTPSAYEQVHE